MNTIKIQTSTENVEKIAALLKELTGRASMESCELIRSNNSEMRLNELANDTMNEVASHNINRIRDAAAKADDFFDDLNDKIEDVKELSVGNNMMVPLTDKMCATVQDNVWNCNIMVNDTSCERTLEYLRRVYCTFNVLKKPMNRLYHGIVKYLQS